MTVTVEHPGFRWLRDARALADGSIDIARYYFHFHDGDSHPDTEGAALMSATAASEEAVNLLGELMRERPWALTMENDWRVEVTDHRGLTLFVVTVFAQASAAMSQ